MSFFAAHRALLDRAVAACRSRTYWSAYPESASGKIYGETAKADGEAAFKAMLGKPFDLDQPSDKRAGKETSPYGMPLGITYPTAPAATLIGASQRAGEGWAAASIEDRVGVCLEIGIAGVEADDPQEPRGADLSALGGSGVEAQEIAWLAQVQRARTEHYAAAAAAEILHGTTNRAAGAV